MSLNSVLFMLLGAVLTAVGVLAVALADRIRGLRASREPAPRDRARRAAAIPVVESADLLRATPPKQPPRAPRAEPKVPTSTEGGDDVITALVASGYKKAVAADAAWACTAGERATIESWTAAALRRCARGGMS